MGKQVERLEHDPDSAPDSVDVDHERERQDQDLREQEQLDIDGHGRHLPRPRLRNVPAVQERLTNQGPARALKTIAPSSPNTAVVPTMATRIARRPPGRPPRNLP